MKENGGLYLDYCKHPDWIIGTLQSAILPKKINQLEKGIFEFKYQEDNYRIQLFFRKENSSICIWIYTDSDELNKNGYKDTTGQYVSTFHTVGITFLLRNLICQNEKINFVECEVFNYNELSLISKRIEERITNNYRIRKRYKSNFNLNKDLKDSDLNLDTIEIIELKKIIAQPCNFYFYSSTNKEKTIEEFLLKVGIELDWDNTFLLETLFLPFTYNEMVNRFRTDWAKNSIKELEIESDENLKINLVFREDELSFLIKTSTKYFYISEVFWWS